MSTLTAPKPIEGVYHLPIMPPQPPKPVLPEIVGAFVPGVVAVPGVVVIVPGLVAGLLE